MHKLKNQNSGFDNTWDKIYASGQQLNKYPYESVVSYIYRNKPAGLANKDINILEVGFGAANNLWFAAREGFDVSGIEGSRHAVDYALQRFNNESLKGNLKHGDFTSLPFADNSFHLAIDRAAITHTGISNAKIVLGEVNRVLKEGGKFYSELFSIESSARGVAKGDGLIDKVEGYYTGVGQVCLYNFETIQNLFRKWNIISIKHCEEKEMFADKKEINSCWKVLAEKKG